MKSGRFHYIARGVCVVDQCVLLAKDVEATNTFLPGGHIEFGENAMDALAREIHEELGVDVQVGDFMGAVEHAYHSSGRDNHEINLVFSFESTDLASASSNPVSREPHLRFYWCPLSELDGHNLLPHPIRGTVNDASLRWGSTIQRGDTAP